MHNKALLRPRAGLTLIEILIALALLGVMVSFVVSSLVGSFQITRENRKSIDATTTAQRIVEDIRGQWRDRATFNTGCAGVTLNSANTSYMAVTANQQNLTQAAVLSGTSSAVTTPCGTLSAGTTCSTPMKRIVVVATDSATPTRTLARVTLDVLCP